MRRSLKREQLLDIAIGLFNERGYHASGIDLILEEAGIAKTTLYRHFETKEDLIVTALKTIDEHAGRDRPFVHCRFHVGRDNRTWLQTASGSRRWQSGKWHSHRPLRTWPSRVPVFLA